MHVLFDLLLVSIHSFVINLKVKSNNIFNKSDILLYSIFIYTILIQNLITLKILLEKSKIVSLDYSRAKNAAASFIMILSL